MKPEDRITYFGETDTRNKRVPFGIKAEDRTKHTYIIGKTGMGKSTLLENMAVQDIKNGEGMAFIDPHGKTADLLLDYIPQERIKDVLYFAPFDLDFPVSFNVMEDVGHDKRHLVANGLMSAFKKIWVDAWSARMEYILNNILLALLEYPDATLIGVNRMLSDKEYRKKVVENITDPSVKAFWTDEFAKYGEKYMQEAGAAIQNKIGQFVSNPLVRNIIGQPKSTFDLRQLMDNKKILIINLSKGRVGEANANLLGSMLITKIYLGAMSRADASTGMMKRLPPFYLYVDEFQNFANESFADILSEARKYKLALTVAHQYIEQMSDEVRAAVFGNVGTMISFRVGAFDAEVLEKEFAPAFTQEDLVNLGFIQIYLKLMIDGVTSPPFSANTLPPIEKPLISFKEDIIRYSRSMFAKPRPQVEEAIKKWHQPIEPTDRDRDGKRIIQAPRGDRLSGDRSQGDRPRDDRRDDRRDRPQDNKKSQDIPNHENELRKIITDSYLKNLKTEEEEKKKRQEEKQQAKKPKSPSQENLSALKNVLASVLKDAPKQEEKKSEVKPEEKKQESKPQEQSQQKSEEKKPEVRQEKKLVEQEQRKSEQHQHQHLHLHQHHENQKQEKPEQKPAQNPPPPSSAKTSDASPLHKGEAGRGSGQEQKKRESVVRDNNPTNQGYSPQEPREVPEEILRKILELDK